MIIIKNFGLAFPLRQNLIVTSALGLPNMINSAVVLLLSYFMIH